MTMRASISMCMHAIMVMCNECGSLCDLVNRRICLSKVICKCVDKCAFMY